MSDSQTALPEGTTHQTLSTLLGTFRVPFLVLTPACVSVGVATAALQGSTNLILTLLILAGALLAHISVNMFNEYDDFTSGLDLATVRTPFSGGSGALPANPKAASLVHRTAWLTLCCSALVGLFFVYLHSYTLIPLGLLGLFLLVSYTRWWVYHPGLCLIAPGLGFGLLMVQGTHFALTGDYSVAAFSASLCPTFLVSALLLLNQFPDVEADKAAGRNHFPIAKGRAASARLYALLLVLAYLSVIVSVLAGVLPALATVALSTAPLALFACTRVMSSPDNIPALRSAMGINVILNLTTPILLAIGIGWGAL